MNSFNLDEIWLERIFCYKPKGWLLYLKIATRLPLVDVLDTDSGLLYSTVLH